LVVVAGLPTATRGLAEDHTSPFAGRLTARGHAHLAQVRQSLYEERETGILPCQILSIELVAVGVHVMPF